MRRRSSDDGTWSFSGSTERVAPGRPRGFVSFLFSADHSPVGVMAERDTAPNSASPSPVDVGGSIPRSELVSLIDAAVERALSAREQPSARTGR